jgi:hypothetical protein
MRAFRMLSTLLLALAAVLVAARSDALNTAEVIPLETGAPAVVAQFNPTEITIDKAVPWKKHKSSVGDSPTLEFTGAEPKTLSVELFFDTFELGQDVYQTHVQMLEKLALIDPTLNRPPLVLFVWQGFPSFTGVVESLSVKYTLFLADGTPVRATCALRLRQADRVRGKKAPEFAATKCTRPEECPLAQTCQGGVCAPPGVPQQLSSPPRGKQ